MAAPPYASGSSWSWPKEDDMRNRNNTTPGAFALEGEEETIHPEELSPADDVQADKPKAEEKQGHYPPRTCRICLEVVQPTYETGPEGLSGFLSPTPRVEYNSEDPESGRLIRPCKCKGSQRYVHEGCLQSWRLANPTHGRQTNYYECPTCKFKYQLKRMRWSQWISSTFAQLMLTLLILFVTIFILGFVADPIINLYFNPVDTFTSSGSRADYYYEELTWTEFWAEHILKGFTSLGLLGAVRTFLMSPWQWFQLRPTIPGGRGRGATGRDRMVQMSWSLVVIVVLTFLLVSFAATFVLSASLTKSTARMERRSRMESQDSRNGQ